MLEPLGTWLIVYPGDFHFLLHIVLAQYKMFDLLMETADILNRPQIKNEFSSSEFAKHEDHLYVTVEGICEWKKQIQNFPQNDLRDYMNCCIFITIMDVFMYTSNSTFKWEMLMQ